MVEAPVLRAAERRRAAPGPSWIPTFVGGLIGIAVLVIVMTEAWLQISEHRVNVALRKSASPRRPWSSLQAKPHHGDEVNVTSGSAALRKKFDALKDMILHGEDKLRHGGSGVKHRLKEGLSGRLKKFEVQLQKLAETERALGVQKIHDAERAMHKWKAGHAKNSSVVQAALSKASTDLAGDAPMESRPSEQAPAG